MQGVHLKVESEDLKPGTSRGATYLPLSVERMTTEVMNKGEVQGSCELRLPKEPQPYVLKLQVGQI